MMQISKHNLERRKAMAAAQMSLTDAMLNHSLTPLEWCKVLGDATARMVGYGVRDELAEYDLLEEVQKLGTVPRELKERIDEYLKSGD